MGEAGLVQQNSAVTSLARLQDRARAYVHQAKAPNTVRAYRSDWADFKAWCDEHQLAALPAEAPTLALYMTELADRCKPSTIQRRLSAIGQAHALAGHPSPLARAEVREVWKGIRRSKGTVQVGKAPLLTAQLRAVAAQLPETLAGQRDRALLLLGFAAALRRSELVGLDVQDVAETEDGLVVQLRKSKTDQEGAGVQVGVPYGSIPATCPVRAVRTWLRESGITDGPLFRAVDRHGYFSEARLSDRAVALVVKRAVSSAGLDAGQYAGHSLRAGLATAAAAQGISEASIMRQTRHRSVAVARKYIRLGSLFTDNAAAGVGL